MTHFDAYDDRPSEPLLTWKRATQLALALALAIALARGMMIELLRDPFEIAPGQAYQPLGTGPSQTLLLNLLSLLPVLLVLARRCFNPDSYRLLPARSPLLLVALGALAMASTFWASDKFAALVSASTLFAASLICWTLAQTVRSWGRFRLIQSAFVGLMLVYVAQGLFYRFVEWPEMRDAVLKSQDQILAERGFEPGSFAAAQFLQRITGGEMVGFGVSPNTYGAVLVMLGLVGAGMLFQGLKDKRDPVLLVATAGTLLAGIWCGSYTHSRTAVATPILGLLLCAVIWFIGQRLLTFRRPVFAAGVLAVLAVLAAVIGHGLYHGTLPSDSLNFRWRYWIGSAHLFADHWQTGVGYANFGPNYLAYRLPAAAEEIRDPHNFLVRFATELGLAGLLAALAWQLLTWWESTRPVSLPTSTPDDAPPTELPLGAISLFSIFALAILINIAASVDFRADAAYVVVELFKRLMYMGLLMVGGTLPLIASRSTARADESPAPLLLIASGAAAAMFLLHNLIDFSLFENGPMMLFAVLIGSIIGVRAASSTPASVPGKRLLPALSLALAATAGIAFTLFPLRAILTAETLAAQADEKIRTAAKPDQPPRPESLSEAARLFRRAFETVPYNAVYAQRAARTFTLARFALFEIRQMLDYAVAADPLFLRALLERARLERIMAANPENPGDLNTALALFKRCTEINPTDIPIRIDYAETLERLGQTAAARTELQTALRYNDLLDPAEPKRLTPTELAHLHAKLESLPK